MHCYVISNSGIDIMDYVLMRVYHHFLLIHYMHWFIMFCATTYSLEMIIIRTSKKTQFYDHFYVNILLEIYFISSAYFRLLGWKIHKSSVYPTKKLALEGTNIGERFCNNTKLEIFHTVTLPDDCYWSWKQAWNCGGYHDYWSPFHWD